MTTTNKGTTTVKPFSGSQYERNVERAGDRPACVVCGRECKQVVGYVHVVDGGSRFATREEHEGAVAVNEAADMGCFPVGPECAKKVAKAGAYVFAMEG